MTPDHDATAPDQEERHDRRPRTWTRPELVELRADATGGFFTFFRFPQDAPTYLVS